MENMSRRKFLKLGGACVAGVGAIAVTKGTAIAGNTKEYVPHKDKLNGQRWGMVIDMRKMENLQACADACHKFHNVPNIDTKKMKLNGSGAIPMSTCLSITPQIA